MDPVLQALAERGVWHGSDDGDAELVRVEIRRAARKAGIKVRTFVDGARATACLHARWLAGARAMARNCHPRPRVRGHGRRRMRALDRLLRDDDAG
jgi:hypothetical protein